MPGRAIPLATGEVYHVFNKGITGQIVFPTKWSYRRFLDAAKYYQYLDAPFRFSQLVSLSVSRRQEVITSLQDLHERRVVVLAYCLMPNHFHILLRQEREGGVARFISDLLNSYTRYINTKHRRQGPLFKGRFKAVRIEDDEQFLHVVRYILLNPYTTNLLKSLEEVTRFPYSSFPEYMDPSSARLADPTLALSHFPSQTKFESFILDYADYQRSLQHIKNIVLE